MKYEKPKLIGLNSNIDPVAGKAPACISPGDLANTPECHPTGDGDTEPICKNTGSSAVGECDTGNLATTLCDSHGSTATVTCDHTGSGAVGTCLIGSSAATCVSTGSGA